MLLVERTPLKKGFGFVESTKCQFVKTFKKDLTVRKVCGIIYLSKDTKHKTKEVKVMAVLFEGLFWIMLALIGFGLLGIFLWFVEDTKIGNKAFEKVYQWVDNFFNYLIQG